MGGEGEVATRLRIGRECRFIWRVWSGLDCNSRKEQGFELLYVVVCSF